tara:strand:- start:219 stop:434 length:216 start_codon:yes stop_codon:yes gene_type:complete
MIQGLVLKGIISAVIKAIEKAPDRRIASNHEKRLKALEKNSHPKSDWVCLECGCKARRVEKPKKKRHKRRK